jgi:hypothetical protein
VRRLLEHLVALLDFLYLDPRNKLAASGSSGSAEANAWLLIAAPGLEWLLVNDRGQVRLSLAPRSGGTGHFYGLTVLRQFVDGGPEIVPTMLDEANSGWLRDNLPHVEWLFDDEVRSSATCAALDSLLKENFAHRDW